MGAGYGQGGAGLAMQTSAARQGWCWALFLMESWVALRLLMLISSAHSALQLSGGTVPDKPAISSRSAAAHRLTWLREQRVGTQQHMVVLRLVCRVCNLVPSRFNLRMLACICTGVREGA